MSKALFLDRDGTLNIETGDYITNPDELVIIPGVRDALLTALNNGYRLFVLTNQSGISKGFFSMDTVRLVNRRLLELLDLPSPGIEEIRVAPESLKDEHIYRKPSPRFLNEKIREHNLDPAQCYMFGDRHSDLLCGLNAGVIPVYLRSGHPPDTETNNFLSTYFIRSFDNLPAALKQLLP